MNYVPFRLSDESGKLVLTPVSGSFSRSNLDNNDGMSSRALNILIVHVCISSISIFGWQWQAFVCLDWKWGWSWWEKKSNDICSCMIQLEHQYVLLIFLIPTELSEGHWSPPCSCFMYQVRTWNWCIQESFLRRWHCSSEQCKRINVAELVSYP